MATVELRITSQAKEAIRDVEAVAAAERKLAGETKNLAGDMNKLAAAEKGVSVETKKIAGEMDEATRAKIRFRAQQKGAAEDIGVTSKAMRGLSNELKDLAKGFVAGLGIAGTTKLMGDAVSKAREFQKQVAGVSLAMSDTKGLDAQTQALRDYALEFGNAAEEQARGMADIVGAGFEGARALDILRQSNKLAAGGMTEVKVTADGLTSVMNAYGDAIRDATDASDTMFVGLRVGKTTIADLSGQLGQVAPIAANVGVSFQQLVAGIAAVTTGGVSTNIAVTQMRSVLSSVLKPSSEATELAKKLGIEFNSAALKAKGLSGFLEDVTKKTKGNKDQMAILFGQVESLGTVFALTGNQADTFESALKQMQVRTGETDKAFAKMEATADFAFKRLATAYDDVLITMGNYLLQTLAPAALLLANNMKLIADSMALVVKVGTAYLAIFVVLPALYAAIEVGIWRMVAANTANNLTLKQSMMQTVSLKQAAGLLFAAWAGWEIGTYLRENFVEARVFGNLLIEALMVGWERVKQGADIMFAAMRFGFMVVVEYVKTQIVGIVGSFAQLADALPNDLGKGLADNLREFNMTITPAIDATTQLRMDVAQANTTFELNRAVINKNIAEMNDWEYANEETAKAVAATAGATKGLAQEQAAQKATSQMSKDELNTWKDTLRDIDQILRDQARVLGDDMVDAGLDYVDAMVKIAEKEKALVALHKLNRDAVNALKTAREQAYAIYQKELKAIRERLTPAQQEIKALDTEIRLMQMSAQQRSVEEAIIRATTAAKAANNEMSASEIANLRAGLTEREKMIDEMLKLDGIVNKFAETDTFKKLVEDIGKVEAALEKAIGEGATDKVAKLQNALGNMRHSMISGIVDSSQAALRSMQTMTKDGSRAFQAMQIAIDALAVVQAISAVLNQAQGDPYTAFARMAAMAAAVAALGVSVGNFASSGFSDTAGERQETQGTGSVLGDSEAKSESILNATEITAAATSKLVGLNRGMLYALRGLQNALGKAAVRLARGAGEADFSGMNLATSSSTVNGLRTLHDSAGLFDFAGIFKARSKITDQGIVIFGGLLGDLLTDISVGAYQEVQSRSWAFGGRTTRTGVVDITDELGAEFELIIGSITDTVRAGAEALGLLPADIQAALDAFKLEEIKISFKGLTVEEQQAELEAVFSKIFDDLAGSVVPFISQFQQVGEGLGETLVRVATEVQVMEQIFTQLGIAVDKTDPEKFAQLADGIVQAAGGLEEAQEMWASFAENFFTPQERGMLQLSTLSGARDQQLDEMGLKPMSKDEFKAAFLAAMPTMTPEEIVEWLHLGELISGVEDALKSLWDSYYQSFYTATEQADMALQDALKKRNDALADLGLDESTTVEQFRAAFEAALPNLSDEQIAQWLLAGQSISEAAEAQEEYNDALADAAAEAQAAANAQMAAQADYLDMVQQLQEELGGGAGSSSAFRSAVAGIRMWERQTTQSMQAAARAAGLTAASERDLALVREVAQERMRRAVQQLMYETQELMRQLGYLGGGLVQSTVENIASHQISQAERVADATDDLYKRQMDGIKGIQDYLDEQLLGDLSHLTPEEKLAEALRQFEEAQRAALAGDPEAMANLPALADAYLRMLRGAEASGTDYNTEAQRIRALLQAVVDAGPTVGPPGTGTNPNEGGGYFAQVLEERDRRTAEQEAAYRANLAQQLAQHLRDLAEALDTPVLQLISDLGINLRQLAADLGINLSNITGESVEALASLASTLGISLSELTGGLGLQLTDLGAGLRELTTGLGINFEEMTGTQVRSLTELAATLGLSLTEITTAMGLNLTDLSEGVLDLTNQLGIDLGNLTAESTRSLASLAQSLGVDLSELSATVGVDLGKLTDKQSLLNQALANTIDDLPQAQRDQLRPLLQAITDATSEADANAAIDNLEDATNDLPPEIRNLLAPYLDDVFPTSASTELDYLSDIYSYARQQLGELETITSVLRDIRRGLTQNPNPGGGSGNGSNNGLASYAVGTSYVPNDMIANIHRGEMILDADTASKLRNTYGVQVPRTVAPAVVIQQTDDRVLAELRALREEVALLRAQAPQISRDEIQAMETEAERTRRNDSENAGRIESAILTGGGRGRL